MPGWREQIVRRFVPGVARVTAVSDADGLLRDPGVFQATQAKGFAIVQFEDSISFRFDYESRFRSKWDAGAAAELVVVFKPGQRDFETLPADVLSNAHRLSFTLKDIFPKLSYAVVSQLETVCFDALYRSQQQHASQPHDETQTRGFVLRHVFGIEPTVIKSVPDLLRMLCQRHYNKATIPPLLDAHIIAALRENSNFAGWPLDIIVPNRAAFWDFLNERWPIFVGQSKGGTMMIQEQPPSLKYPGPELLPFGHDDVRIYIDNLFEDGLLTPVEWDWSQAIEKTWIRVGLLGNKAENTDLRFEELGKHLLEKCPDKSATPQDWLAYAYRYAQANVLWTQVSPTARAQYQKQFPELRGYVNQQFFDWLSNHYAGLYKVDKIMHGMQLGTVGMSGQVRTWAEQGFPLALLTRLREHGFEIFISADHGNTEAVGIGRPQEGVLSDKRGERCRIYSDPMLRKECLANLAGTQPWDHAGLPEGICTLLSPYGKAFTQDGTTLLCHGGAALEEVCVPFIRIPAHT